MIQIPPGALSINTAEQLSRILDALVQRVLASSPSTPILSFGGGFSTKETTQNLDPFTRPFPVRVTDFDSSTGLYSWNAVVPGASSSYRGWFDYVGGRSGTKTATPLYERNGKTIPILSVVWARLAYYDLTLDWVYVCDYEGVDLLEAPGPPDPVGGVYPSIPFLTIDEDGDLWVWNPITSVMSKFCSCDLITYALLKLDTLTYTIDGEPGGSVTITVTRDFSTTGIVTVDYTTVDGTATAGTDYTATSGTLTLGDTVGSATFAVPVSAHVSMDTYLNFTVELSTPTGVSRIENENKEALITITSPYNIVTDCCPSNSTPQTLYATFAVTEGTCDVCVPDGVLFYYDYLTDTWKPSSWCAGRDIYLKCVSDTWLLVEGLEDAGSNYPVATASCSPLSLLFSDVVLAGDCLVDVTVVGTAPATQVITSPGTATFTAPSNMVPGTLSVEGWGGGGGGGGSALSGSGGGGGSSYSQVALPSMVGGDTISYTVGAGGAGGDWTIIQDGVPGGDTFTGSLEILAKSGSGGVAGGPVSGGNGGNGGVGVIGDIHHNGGNGAAGNITPPNDNGGGGGGSASATANGNNGAGTVGGTGQATGGTGGTGSAPTAGSAPGAGGGGGGKAQNGAAGADGKVIFSWIETL